MWKQCLESFKLTSVPFEVVFGGPCTEEQIKPFLDEYKFFRYLKTGNIKPAQVYEITRRACVGETIVWFCDDGEVNNDVIGKAYTYWKVQNNEKLILSIQTKESGYGQKDGKLFPMKEHTFFSGMPETPLMAPIAMMSRKFLEELGGYDVRYVSGQTENDVVMRAYTKGATVAIFGDENTYVDIDHLGKSIMLGESTDEVTFLERPFATGYMKDREILENSWTYFDHVSAIKRLDAGERPYSLRTVSPKQLDEFQSYPSEISLTHSLSNKGKWQ